MEQQNDGRFTSTEISLIKKTFKDNLPLLKAIRKVFLQIELSEREDIMINKPITATQYLSIGIKQPLKNAPVYSNLKNGTKPTYRQYHNKTQKNYGNNN